MTASRVSSTGPRPPAGLCADPASGRDGPDLVRREVNVLRTVLRAARDAHGCHQPQNGPAAALVAAAVAVSEDLVRTLDRAQGWTSPRAGTG